MMLGRKPEYPEKTPGDELQKTFCKGCRRHIKQLEEFHTRALRMIMGICWQDRLTNREVPDRAGSTGIESMLLKAQLHWTDHVIRMIDSRIPRQLLYSEVMCDSRKQESLKLRFKDTLKSKLNCSCIGPRELEASANS